MWYSGNDGTTWRILEAIQPGGGTWERVGVAIDAGFAGDSDNYGVESPCVVKTPGGYLMIYGGFDGDVARLHMATSLDGRQWVAQGTIMQRGREDAAGASHPCVVMTGERWWLFFSGYDGSNDNRRAAILAAISQSGASWDRLGTVLTPDEGSLRFPIRVSSTSPGHSACSMPATMGGGSRLPWRQSADGLSWDRRGTVLAPSGEGPDGLTVHAPCVVRLHDGSLRMWYSGLAVGDADLAYRICSARSLST